MKVLFKVTVKIIAILIILFFVFNLLAVFQVEHSDFQLYLKMDDEVQEKALALVITSFHSYYHMWPGRPAPIDNNVQGELMGDELATINKDKINFFKLTDSSYRVDNYQNKRFCFRVDDSTGTCVVFIPAE
jgi:hypothetical protein